MPYDEEGEWYSYTEWVSDPLPLRDTEYKAVEVSPGIVYVIEAKTGEYAKHLAKKSIVMLPHGSKLIATVEANFPEQTTSVVTIPVEEL